VPTDSIFGILDDLAVLGREGDEGGVGLEHRALRRDDADVEEVPRGR
jgi:hypothetical protein